MRIAIGQVCQETNTFNPLPAIRRNFEVMGHANGPDTAVGSGRGACLPGTRGITVDHNT